jgi:hypothetical protein
MPACAICDLAIEGPPLTDHETGRSFHPACVAERVPADLAIALIALAAAVVVPPIVVWGS